jgi:hypothetical protein
MKKTKKRLDLKKEYLRILSTRDLTQPRGGRDVFPTDEESCQSGE